MDGVTSIRPSGVYRLSALADSLGVSLRTLERAVAAGDLIARRVGRYTFVTGRNLLAWLEGGAGASGKDLHKPEEVAQP
jgi:hypothetical protein